VTVQIILHLEAMSTMFLSLMFPGIFFVFILTVRFTCFRSSRWQQ